MGPLAKPELVQRRVQQYPGVIAGKRPAGAIGAVHAGRQADDQQARLRVAEGRHRPAEVARAPSGARHRETRRDAGSAGTLGSKALFICRAGGRNSRWAQQKTGYAETPRSPPSITRGFGLTRAQPNLRPYLRAWNPSDSLRRRKIPRNASLILLLVVRAVRASRRSISRGGKGLQGQNSICTHRGKSAFQKPPP